MDVEVQGGAYVGMTEDDAHRFVVAVALDAASSEAVAQTVEFDYGDCKLLQQTVVIVSVSAWFCRLAVVAQNIKGVVHDFHQGHQHFIKLGGEGNLTT